MFYLFHLFFSFRGKVNTGRVLSFFLSMSQEMTLSSTTNLSRCSEVRMLGNLVLTLSWILFSRYQFSRRSADSSSVSCQRYH